MTDRTIEQINHNLDQVLAISAENTRNIAELQLYVAQVAGTVERIALATDQRLNRQDQIISMLSAYITGTSPASDEPS
jgi:hypothetical protein